MRAVYLNPISNQITEKSQVHHLSNVLRLRRDEDIFVFDGSGSYYQARVLDIQKKFIELSLGDELIYQAPHNLELALAWIKKDALETALNTATQLGISKIHFFHSDYSQKAIDLSKERFRKILISAAEQSNNFHLPELIEHDSIESLYSQNSWDKHFCFSLKDIAHSENKADEQGIEGFGRGLYWIGPEGGFSNAEIEVFYSKSMNFFHLQVPIMRAPVAVSCALGYILGNLNGTKY